MLYLVIFIVKVNFSYEILEELKLVMSFINFDSIYDGVVP